ncbi:MAG: tRNA (adenosine(37)-N6)-threonylcarbamoyltransferase complex ATPase subunit type 1 TsaE [Spirochaetaceae bacterium]|jgi:tRNA threonylcarbamoyladenosine biosynthesis protein TsaE|nr:tRNA (adenosine(37)-N6)-threonylcarbamoyltransferase complex ATPase subunit type 1 TsaE [Spirochaetaceae bacterium]
MNLTERAAFRFERVSASPLETFEIGEELAARLWRGSVVALRGKLGAGKTQFVKGLARGLGISDRITSPTYTIISEYEGTMPLYHMDAYRLRSEEEFVQAGGEELFYGNGVSVVEWSERIEGLIPGDAVLVEIDITGSEERRVTIRYPARRENP